MVGTDDSPSVRLEKNLEIDEASPLRGKVKEIRRLETTIAIMVITKDRTLFPVLDIVLVSSSVLFSSTSKVRV